MKVEIAQHGPDVALAWLVSSYSSPLHCGREWLHHREMPDRAPNPTDDRQPAWRAACLAYREKRRAEQS